MSRYLSTSIINSMSREICFRDFNKKLPALLLRKSINITPLRRHQIHSALSTRRMARMAENPYMARFPSWVPRLKEMMVRLERRRFQKMRRSKRARKRIKKTKRTKKTRKGRKATLKAAMIRKVDLSQSPSRGGPSRSLRRLMMLNLKRVARLLEEQASWKRVARGWVPSLRWANTAANQKWKWMVVN